ncbi:hypothetical protein M9H77_20308 [Catharanthus roseus]|uniref:Uncharacterized protein n=1 Tax=Catharanthus roseus TaxID=4058 RepID=A0ACC0AJD8_CATRO|nr:hypothetical protein M9H77_20308 [Catharanthus roseus]
MPSEQEINRKRKNNGGHDNFQIPRKFSFDINKPEDDEQEEDEDNDFLNLTLSFHPSSAAKKLSQAPPQPPHPPPPPPAESYFHQPPLHLSPNHPIYLPTISAPPPVDSSSSSSSSYRQESAVGPSRPTRQRRNPSQNPREGKSETVPVPYPWATNQRATIHSFNDLLYKKQIDKISGEVQCKKCERQYEMEFDLKEKFAEIGNFIAANKSSMHDRAPGVWMNPVLPKCKFCEQENSVKPIISDKKKSINWLFLLLGKMLGCCTLEQLKYFCKHTKNHRTGAKDRVLYLTYLSLCKQLDPTGPFDR